MKFNRRRFLQAFGASAAVAITPSMVKAASAPKVVVIGGGFAGATAAKYLRMWSNHTIDVTLVDAKAQHTSCVMSNLVLNGQLKLQQLKLSYSSLASIHGVHVKRDKAISIDGDTKVVELRDQGSLRYDYLLLATGIGFQKKGEVDFNLTPHAWIAGGQTNRLANMVNTLGPSSTFVMTVPKSPYRCPPGPYERACLVADILKRRGYDNGDAKVIVLDANASIQAEEHTFSTAFEGIYGNIIEYIPNAPVQSVDSVNRVVATDMGDFTGDVVNYIPDQRAPGFVRRSGVTNSGNWAPVDPVTYASTLPGFESVYVIGDIQGTGQPKSGHMANAQAKVCADAIIRTVDDKSNYTDDRLKNITTNSACYSPITYDKASYLTANFRYDKDQEKMVLTQLGEAENWNTENYQDMFGWASNLFTDSFH